MPWVVFFVGGLIALLFMTYWAYSMMGAMWLLMWVGLPYQIAFMFSIFAPVAIPFGILCVLDFLYWKRVERDYEED